MNHTPTLHIFIGERNHYFTLRESYLHTRYIRGIPEYEVRYHHIKNLSQNWTEALEKAQAASKYMGFRLVARESEIEQLKEIKRLTAEEIEQQKKAQQEAYRLAEEEAYQRRLMYWNLWVKETTLKLEGKVESERFGFPVEKQQDIPNFAEWAVKEGWVVTEDNPDEYTRIMDNPDGPYMPIGAHRGISLSRVPLSYFQWLVYKSEILDGVEDTTFNKMAFVVKWIKENMEIPVPVDGEHVGTVGEKMTTEVTIDSVRTVQGYYGNTTLYTFLDENQNVLTWFASKPALHGLEGLIKLAFTVKAHKEYRGTNQTLITRAKVVK